MLDNDGEFFSSTYGTYEWRELPPCGCGRVWSGNYAVEPHRGNPNYAAHSRGAAHRAWLRRNTATAKLRRLWQRIPFSITVTLRRKKLIFTPLPKLKAPGSGSLGADSWQEEGRDEGEEAPNSTTSPGPPPRP